MKTSNTLFELIRSLTQSEKRYFKVNADRHAGSGINNYVLLFDAIDAQDMYDETAIRRSFKKEKFIRQLSVAKNYLHNEILKNLEAYHAEGNMTAKVRRLIRQAELLFEKTLYAQAEKNAQKAHRLAERYELFPELMLALKLEKNIIAITDHTSHRNSRLESLHTQTRTALQQHEYNEQYWMFITYLSSIGSSKGRNETQQLNSLLKHPLLKKPPASLPYLSQHYLHNIHAHSHIIREQMEKAYPHFVKGLKHLQSNPTLLKEMSRAYFTHLYNFLVISLSLRKMGPEAYRAIDEFRELAATVKEWGNTPDMRAKVFTNYYNLEMVLCNSTGEFKRGIALLPELEAGIKMYENQSSRSMLIRLYYVTALVCFGAGKYKDALPWTHRILNEPDSAQWHNLYSMTKILVIILHYELGNDRVLEYQIKSTYRYFRKKDKLHDLEKVLLNFFRRELNNIHNDTELKAAFQRLKTSLGNTKSDPIEKTALVGFSILAWLESKVSKKSYAKLLSEQFTSK